MYQANQKAHITPTNTTLSIGNSEVVFKAATGRSHSTANISEYEQFSNLIKMSCFDSWLTLKKYGQKSERFN